MDNSESSPPATAPVAEAESTLSLLIEARAGFSCLQAQPNYGGKGFVDTIQGISHDLMRANDRNPDIAIAAILLRQESDYSVRHAINVAVVADQLLRVMDRNAEQRLPVIAAALTMNLGMHALQSELAQQSTPLSAEQRQAMQQHPVHGRDLLRRLGVSDPLWLDCVAQHHEQYDGTGYPLHLRGEAIHFEARLLGMADRYCAMLNRTNWRHEQLADSALLSALGGPAGSPEEKLGRLFIQKLGIYPAGTVVQLINGEIGMVKSQTDDETAPMVLALFNAIFEPLKSARQVDTRLDDYTIVSVLDRREVPVQISMAEVWGAEATC